MCCFLWRSLKPCRGDLMPATSSPQELDPPLAVDPPPRAPSAPARPARVSESPTVDREDEEVPAKAAAFELFHEDDISTQSASAAATASPNLQQLLLLRPRSSRQNHLWEMVSAVWAYLVRGLVASS